MASRPARPRPAGIQLYKPPKARSTDEQAKKSTQIIDFVEEAPNPSEPVRATSARVHQQSKRTNKQKSTRGNKPSSEISSGPQERATDAANGIPAVEVMSPGETGEVIRVELSQRVFGDVEDLQGVAKVIESEKPDCHIVSSEGRGVCTNVELLKLMSPYFSCTLQEGWAETRRKVIKTKIPRDALEPVVAFMHRGEILLTESNVCSIFVVAEYLQIECLMEACRKFITNRIDSMFDKAIALGMKHGGMSSVAEEAVDYICGNLAAASDRLSLMKPEMIMMVISRDELNVASEDEVCDFVLLWLQRGPDDEQIRQMLECVRLPHLTEKSFNKLCEALKDKGKLPLIEAVRLGKFVDLPEDQLARRFSYERHVHGVWKESKTKLVPRFFHLDEDLRYRIECVRSRKESVTSKQLLHSFREFRKQRTSFEFVPVMNSLFMITHTKPYDFILMYQQLPNGRWIQRIKYRRWEPVPDFASSVTGSDLYLCIFDGFNRPLKTLLFKPLSFADAEEVDYRAPMPMFFSPPRMVFREDIVIYMLDATIEILDRATHERQTIKPRDRGGRSIKSMRFTDILVHEDKVYAYEEPPSPELRDAELRLIHDRLYIICLKKKEIDTVMDVIFPRFARRESRVMGGENYRCSKMSIVGSRLVLHKYFESHDSSMIVEFDAEKNVFNKVAEIPCSDGVTYYRKLMTLIPVHLHQCEHGSLLQKYCNSIDDPTKAGELEKLSFYL